MSKKVKIAINGFGRIGRLCAREIIEKHSDWCSIVLINEIVGGAEIASYLFQFDSAHGKYHKECKVVENGYMKVEGYDTLIKVTGHSKIEEVPWKELGVSIVLECTGKFVTQKSLEPYLALVDKVIVSAPVNDIPNIVVGCNDHTIKVSDRIITCASCTTNCLAPVVKVIDEAFGIDSGTMTTCHCITNTQSILDAVNKKKDDPRRARSGMLNLAPTSTGSAKAIGLIYPHLKGRINGIAIRVPMQNSSITDMVFNVKKDIESAGAVNNVLKEASMKMPNILGYEERPLVSSDYVNDPRSSIIDAPSTMVVGKRTIKILSWYDNEYGYSCRMVDLLKLVNNVKHQKSKL